MNRHPTRRSRITPPVLLAACLTTFFVVPEANAQSPYNHPTDCWLLNQSGYVGPFTGSNPSLSDIKDEIATLSATYNVPCEIIAAVAYHESIGLYQFGSDNFVVHNKPECQSIFNGQSTNAPPGLGLMQLTGATATNPNFNCNANGLIIDWRCNLDAGVQVLKSKYEYAAGLDPACIRDLELNNRDVLENWYYAIRYYNGYQEQNTTYLDQIYLLISNPPARLSGFYSPVAVQRPETVIGVSWVDGKGFVALPCNSWRYYNCANYPGTTNWTSCSQTNDFCIKVTYVASGLPVPDDTNVVWGSYTRQTTVGVATFRDIPCETHDLSVNGASVAAQSFGQYAPCSAKQQAVECERGDCINPLAGESGDVGKAGATPLFQVGDRVEVYNTGGIGLRAWIQTCSDTYVVMPDGAKGTIQDGPQCCSGYDRWKILYDGESIPRWSAEGDRDTGEKWLRSALDITPPTIAISVPCNSSCSSSTTPISVAGTATDAGGSGLDYVVALNIANFSYGIQQGLSGNSTPYSISGLVLNTGTNTIRVQAADRAGNFSLVATLTVTYSPATLSSIQISGPTQVDENAAAQYTCTAYFSNGSQQNVTNQASWSDNSNYATINATNGNLSTINVPSDQPCRITATFGGQQAILDLTIRNVSINLTSITMSGPGTVDENSFAQYQCTAYYSNNSTSDVTSSATWSMISSPYATIDSAGSLTTDEVPYDQPITLLAHYGSQSTNGLITIRNTNSTPPALLVTPAENYQAVGLPGGPFAPFRKTYTVANTTAGGITWSMTSTVNWLSTSSGSLGPYASTNIELSVSGAGGFAPGVYTGSFSFINDTNHSGDVTRQVILTVSSPNSTCVLHTLVSPTSQANDHFGQRMAVLGDRLVANPIGGNAVYVFDASSGVFMSEIDDPVGGTNFGFNVAPLGNNVLIAAPQTNNSMGAAYLFDGITGARIQTFNNPTIYNYFGSWVAGVGGNAAIGSPQDSTVSTRNGSVYIMNPTTGQVIRTIHNPQSYTNAYFGTRVVAAGGNKLLVNADPSSATRNGVVHLFDSSTGSLLHSFPDPVPTYQFGFGEQIAAAGNDILITGPENNSTIVYVFDATTWNLRYKIYNPYVGAFSTTFGASILEWNGYVVVGDPSTYAGQLILSGVIHFFDSTSGAYRGTAANPVPTELSRFGASLAGKDDILFVGAPGANGSGIPPGRVYMMQLGSCSPPQIAQHPQTATACEGQSANFSLTATSDTPLSYQWRKDGTNISGATDPVYSIPVVALTDSGSYDCVVTNSGGSVDSNDATLTVSTAPAITSHPSNLTKCVGQSASLQVAAAGPDLAYQWRKNGVNIPGAASDSFTVAAVTQADASNYVCLVSNGCGLATSYVAVLTVFLNNTADGNADGFTDATDIAAMIDALLSGGPPSGAYCAYDFSGNGIVDLADLPLFVTRLLGSE